uniref:Transposase or IS (ACLAME 318) n=1 Tax=Klebsiella pneumoniae TaxID=573 RepID=A0A8B0STP3_KLEPN|nr:Putative transposase or IS (ACLAME 318) [Klebsiella pneumoniae]
MIPFVSSIFDKYCQLEYRRVKLPSGLGWVTFRQSRAVVGKIKKTQRSASTLAAGISRFR